MTQYLKLKQKHDTVEEAGELDLLQDTLDKLSEALQKCESIE